MSFSECLFLLIELQTQSKVCEFLEGMLSSKFFRGLENNLLRDAPLLSVDHVLELEYKVQENDDRHQKTQHPSRHRLKHVISMKVQRDRLTERVLVSEKVTCSLFYIAESF